MRAAESETSGRSCLELWPRAWCLGDRPNITTRGGWPDGKDDFDNRFESAIRFDAESLSSELVRNAKKLGVELQPLRRFEPNPNHHPYVVLHDLKLHIQFWVESVRKTLRAAIDEKGELVEGWESDESHRLPNVPISDVGVLREWLVWWLSALRKSRSNEWTTPESYLDDICREL